MTKKISIINYDDLVGEDAKPYNIPQIPSPFSMILNGTRGTGKTNLVTNMLLGVDGSEPLLYYDKVYILSLSKGQKKYAFIQSYFDEVKEEIEKEMNKKKKKGKNENVDMKMMNGSIKNTKNKKDEKIEIDDICTMTDDWRELPRMEDFTDKEPNKDHIIIIMDDVITLYEKDKAFANYVKKLYVAGRHQRLSPVFLTQSYCMLENAIRMNSTMNIFVGRPTRNLLMTISMIIPILDYKGYKELFGEYIENAFDFVFINTDENDLNKKVWVDNFNTAVDIKTLQNKYL